MALNNCLATYSRFLVKQSHGFGLPKTAQQALFMLLRSELIKVRRQTLRGSTLLGSLLASVCRATDHIC
jgi:hypothetical protein